MLSCSHAPIRLAHVCGSFELKTPSNTGGTTADFKIWISRRLHDAWRRCAAEMLSCSHAPIRSAHVCGGDALMPPDAWHRSAAEMISCSHAPRRLAQVCGGDDIMLSHTPRRLAQVCGGDALMLSCSQTIGTSLRRRCSHAPIRLAQVCDGDALMLSSIEIHRHA